jgi:hypothetical protein
MSLFLCLFFKEYDIINTNIYSYRRLNMKVVAKDIDMICHFDNKGIHPIKFRYQEKDGDEYKVIKVDKVITRTREKLCGNLACVFECQSLIDEVVRPYQIKYIVQDMKWILFKI